MQLVAYGAQDIYLTGNPQITFFKVVYRRHTNFSMECIEQTINGSSKTDGGSGSVTISRNGDLVYKVYVTSDTEAITNGDEIVSEVELEIGGQKIDKHYKEWNQVWNELCTPESKAVGFKSMKGCVGSSGTTGPGLVQVPLNFWFCRNPGLALPLIALQYHEVKLKITWGAFADVGSAAAGTCKVMCDYIYLDTDERRRFAQVSHEYLIEQIQLQSASASTTNKLNFNHPVKELIWVTAATNAYATAKLVLNGHDRFSDQQEEYFQLRQPFDYHTAVPAQNLPMGSGGHVRIEILDGTASVGEARDGSVSGTGKCQTIGAISNTTVAADSSLLAGITGGDDVTGDTPATLGYLFHEADLTTQLSGLSSLVAGDVVQIEVTGVASAADHATKTTNITTTVRSKTLSAGLDNFTGTLLQFNTSLLEATFAAAAGVNLTINSITKIAPYSVGCRTSQMTKKINVYSFGLKPEEHQPSGTCNFSRIDNAQLKTGAALVATDNIYAVNYNVLRIMSGMGGLAYSN